jgi:hypothetical protein
MNKLCIRCDKECTVESYPICDNCNKGKCRFGCGRFESEYNNKFCGFCKPCKKDGCNFINTTLNQDWCDFCNRIS